jgi:hypothetical protein
LIDSSERCMGPPEVKYIKSCHIPIKSA